MLKRLARSVQRGTSFRNSARTAETWSSLAAHGCPKKASSAKSDD